MDDPESSLKEQRWKSSKKFLKKQLLHAELELDGGRYSKQKKVEIPGVPLYNRRLQGNSGHPSH
jgi:hypothetical protein